MARHFGDSLSPLLGRYDGRWFIGVAEHGYDTTVSHRADGSLVNTNVVLFPGYPYLIESVAFVTGLSTLWAGIVTSWLAGIAAAWGIFSVGYLAWVAHALDRLDGWSYMQRAGWHLRFDGGSATLHTLVNRVLLEATSLELYEVTAVLLASIVLVILLAFLRPPWPLLAYAAGLLVLTLGGAGYYHSKA